MRIAVPSGRTRCEAEIPDDCLVGIFEPSFPTPECSPEALVELALDSPFGSARLEDIAARGVRKAVILCSDHTRPVPSKVLIPPLLRKLRAGAPDVEITLLIGTGCHRAPTKAELEAKFGEEIVARERIVVHHASDSDSVIRIGTLPSGGPLELNKLAVEADLLVAEGFVEPHFFAGFSGGRKSVLPGIASRSSVLANHCAEFIADPRARTGLLDGNPIHRDMLWAARKVSLAFILNVVLDPEKRVLKAFAGDVDMAHRKGAEFVAAHAGVKAPRRVDIVITGNGGAPLDQNVYQCVKCMTAAEPFVREGGAIVVCAECADGHGGEAFMRMLSDFSPEELLRRIGRVPRDGTEPDQWQVQILARVASRSRIVFVSPSKNHEMLRKMRFETASTLSQGIEIAKRISGSPDNATIAVIPDGVSVIAEPPETESAKV